MKIICTKEPLPSAIKQPNPNHFLPDLSYQYPPESSAASMPSRDPEARDVVWAGIDMVFVAVVVLRWAGILWLLVVYT